MVYIVLREPDKFALNGMQYLLGLETQKTDTILAFETLLAQILAKGSLTAEEALHLAELYDAWFPSAVSYSAESTEGTGEAFPDRLREDHLEDCQNIRESNRLFFRQVQHNQELLRFRACLRRLNRQSGNPNNTHGKRQMRSI